MEITLREIAETVDGRVIGDGNILIKGINSLDAAAVGDISFFYDLRYRKYLESTMASALLVAEENRTFKGPQVIVDNPPLAYARVAMLFAPRLERFEGISPQAYVDPGIGMGDDVSVYPGVYVGRKCYIGNQVTLFPGVYVGEGVEIGDRTVIYPNVTILRGCIIGRDVTIHAGTVIGSDGFGFVREGTSSVKIPQLGIVQIDDHVEIGANNCIDRAALGKTWIKRGVKTDNLVQIGHNVIIGEDTIVVAQVGISGSVRVGREVVIAGQVGISDHLEIGDRVMIGPQSGVIKSIPSEDVVSGTPTMPHRLWLKTSGLVARLPEYTKRVRKLEKRIEELERTLKKE